MIVFPAVIVTACYYHVPLKNRDFTEFLILIVTCGSFFKKIEKLWIFDGFNYTYIFVLFISTY